MKKSLLALAVLGAFAGTAVAQSSVTIYGSIDVGVVKSNGGDSGNPGNAFAIPAGERVWAVNPSHAPRLGFRGNEDLGGGLSAQFQIEHRYRPDTGVQDQPAFWHGRSYVQLTHAAAGSVYLGREYSPTFWLTVKSDPFGYDGVGALGSLMYGAFRDPNPSGGVGQVRMANVIGYKTPSFGGLTAQIATSLGEGVVGRTDGLNVEYGAGPLYAGFAFERVRGGPAAAAGSVDGDKLMAVALHYDLGFVKPMAYYSRSEVDATGLDVDFWSLGALAPIGPGRLKVVYADFDRTTPAGNDGRKFAIGYDYPLSKRTNLYTDVAITKVETLSRNATWAIGAKHTF
jgi:predicted porin